MVLGVKIHTHYRDATHTTQTRTRMSKTKLLTFRYTFIEMKGLRCNYLRPAPVIVKLFFLKKIGEIWGKLLVKLRVTSNQYNYKNT
jgi:hypothetical protein